jgi:hypothetical protein
MNTQPHYIPVHLDLPGDKIRWMDISRFPDLPLMNSAAIVALEEFTLETSLNILTTLNALPAKPSGFIFHTSRCGSTLLTKILQRSANVLAFNEPQPINALLVNYATPHDNIANPSWQQQGNTLINNVLTTYLYTQKKIFIKFSSFNLLLLDSIMKLWPNVPIVFLYRNPVEVVVSNLEKQGGFLTKRYNRMLKYMLRQCNLHMPDDLTDEEYCVKMIDAFFYIILQHIKAPQSAILPMDYETISTDTVPDIFSFFGLEVTTQTRDAINNCMNHNAKNGTPFKKDATSKHAKASQYVRDLCEQFAWKNYHALKQYSQPLRQ